MAADHGTNVLSLRNMFETGFQAKLAKPQNMKDFSSDLGRKHHGFGREELTDGEGFYEGKFKFKTRHGQGNLVQKDAGCNYNGQFRNDKYHGLGQLTLRDGCVYDGQWVDGVKQGHGVLTTSTTEYEGQFADGVKHGLGRQTYENGDVYDGGWYRGQISGLGTYYFADGSQYQGAWLKGRYQGTGLLYMPGRTRERRTYDEGVLIKREILTAGEIPMASNRAKPVVRVSNILHTQLQIEMHTDTVMNNRQHLAYAIKKPESDGLDLSAPSIRPKRAATTAQSEIADVSGAAIPRQPSIAEEALSFQEISVCESAEADAEVAGILGKESLSGSVLGDASPDAHLAEDASSHGQISVCASADADLEVQKLISDPGWAGDDRATPSYLDDRATPSLFSLGASPESDGRTPEPWSSRSTTPVPLMSSTPEPGTATHH